MPRFHAASALTPGHLGPATPLGLFQTINMPAAALLWVVEDGDAKWAIVLRSHTTQRVFEALPLLEDTPWVGFSLGPVEVLVDPSRAQFDPEPLFGRGAITVTRGQVFIGAMPAEQVGERVAFAVADAPATISPAAAIFGYWQLVQRTLQGKPVVLYELD